MARENLSSIEILIMTVTVGLFHQLWAPVGVKDPQLLSQVIEDTRWADQLGYASLWLGEHHGVRSAPFYGRIPSPELLMAHLAAETDRIRLGTGVKVLTLDDPVRFAESMVMLDLMAPARVEFGIGQGSGLDVQHQGWTIEEKRQRFRHHLSMLMDCLDPPTDQPPISTFPLSPRPSSELRQRIWIACRDRSTLEQVRDLDLHLVVGQVEAGVRQRRTLDQFRQLGGQGQVRGCRLVHVAETEPEALAAVAEAALAYFEVYSQGPYYQEGVAEGRISAHPPQDLRDLLRRVDFLVGDPESVTRQVQEYLQITGVDQLDVMMHVAGIKAEAIRRSMHLFQQAVAPQLRIETPRPGSSSQIALTH